jgi:hypothetical protein
VSRRASAESIPPSRAVAVTAIEHGNIIITVTRQVREAELRPPPRPKALS